MKQIKNKNERELNKKFQHHSWWRGQGLTKRQVLDRMAKSGDFYIGKKPKPSKYQSSYLLDDILYDDIIKYAGKEGGTYKISQIEKEYFLSRKKYYTKLLQAENRKKRADPQYQLQKEKEKEQDLARNVRWAKRELEYAKRDNDTHRIEYWTKAIQEKKQRLVNFQKSIKKATTTTFKANSKKQKKTPKTVNNKVKKRKKSAKTKTKTKKERIKQKTLFGGF